MKLSFKRSSAMSLPKAQTIHGIEVKKVPVGKYIQSMQEIQDLPQTIIETCFPDEGNLEEIVTRARHADGSYAVDLFSRLLIGAPGVIIGLASTFLEIEDQVLLDLTPAELMDVLDAWWALNDMTDFFKRVWGKIKPLIASYQARTDGSSAG